MSELYIKLPYPPSMNTYWRHVVVNGSPRTLLSKKGREYRQKVMALICFDDITRPAITGRVAVSIELCAPDKRKRDLDNLPKSILDALTHAGVWEDDSQIDDLHLTRGTTGKPGHAMVVIRYDDNP